MYVLVSNLALYVIIMDEINSKKILFSVLNFVLEYKERVCASMRTFTIVSTIFLYFRFLVFLVCLDVHLFH